MILILKAKIKKMKNLRLQVCVLLMVLAGLPLTAIGQPLYFHRDVTLVFPPGVELIEIGDIQYPGDFIPGIPLIPEYDFPQYPPDDLPNPYYLVYLYAGQGANVLCVNMFSECEGTLIYGSCDLRGDHILNFLMSQDPNNDASWLNYNMQASEGFKGNGNFYRTRRVQGCIQFSGTVLINWRNFPPWVIDKSWFGGFDENGQVPLVPPTNDDILNPPISVDIVSYDYTTDLPSFDLRERYFIKLLKQNLDPDSKPPVLHVDLELNNPGGNSSFWTMPVYYYGTTNGGERIYLSDPNEVIFPRDKANSLENWTEGPQDQVRTLLATYADPILVWDDASVRHNLVTVTQISPVGNPLRSSSAEYRVTIEPGITGYDFFMSKWTFSPGSPDLEPVEQEQYALGGAVSFELDTKIAGVMVADGYLQSDLIFRNRPDTRADDAAVLVNGWNSSSIRAIQIEPRDWSFDEDFVERYWYKSMSGVVKPPSAGDPTYKYSSLADIQLLDGRINRNGIPDNLSRLRFFGVSSGPNKGYSYIPSAPYRYFLQSYVYPGLNYRANVNNPQEEACFTFNARQGDSKDNLEINFEFLQDQLIFGLGRGGGQENDTYEGRALSRLALGNEPNDVAEKFLRMTDLSMEEKESEFWDSIELKVMNDIQAVDNIDVDNIRKYNPLQDAQWPPFVHEVHFCDRTSGQREIIPGGARIDAHGPIILKFILQNDGEVGQNPPEVQFTISSGAPPPPADATSDWFDPDLTRVSGAVYYWTFSDADDIFPLINVDDYLQAPGAELTATVRFNNIDYEDDIELKEVTDKEVTICNSLYGTVPDDAVFWEEWTQIWFKVTGYTQLDQPVVEAQLNGGISYGPDFMNWDPVSSTWHGRFTVDAAPGVPVIAAVGQELRVYLPALPDVEDKISIFGLDVQFSDYNGVIHDNVSFLADRAENYPRMYDQYLYVKVSPRGLFSDNIQPDLITNPPGGVWVNSLMAHQGEFTTAYYLPDQVSGPWFRVNSWTYNVEPPAANVGRLTPLNARVQHDYGAPFTDWWPALTVHIESDWIEQDEVEILRQEYLDYTAFSTALMPYSDILTGGLLTERPGATGGWHFHTTDGVITQNPGQLPYTDIWVSPDNSIETIVNYVSFIIGGNTPIIWESGYRCPVKNKMVGGSRTSKHMTGRAADCHVQDNFLSQREESIKYYQIYQDLHVDTDGEFTVLFYGYDNNGRIQGPIHLKSDRFRSHGENLESFPNPVEDTNWPFEYRNERTGVWMECYYGSIHVQNN